MLNSPNPDFDPKTANWKESQIYIPLKPSPEAQKTEAVRATSLKAPISDGSVEAELKARVYLPATGRFDAKSLAQILVQKFKNRASIVNAIDHLTVFDSRFNGTDPRFEFSKEAKQAILDELFNLPLSGEIKDSPPTLLAPKVARELIALVVRKPVETNYTHQDREIVMRQVSGHVEGSEQKNEFVAGTTLCSELQKNEPNIREIANQGYIESEPGTNSSKIVLSRSGRTDSKDKIEKKSLGDIYARFQTGSQKGLQKVVDEEGNTFYAYRRVDCSFMDTSFIKSMATSFVSGFKAIINFFKGKESIVENERAFFEKKKSTVEAMWNNAAVDSRGAYLERTVRVPHNGVPAEIKVREYRPLVFNFVFSGQAKPQKFDLLFGSNLENARVDNIPSSLMLLKLLYNKKVLDNPEWSSWVNDSRMNLDFVVQQLKQEYSKIDPAKAAQKIFVVKAMYALLTGKDFEGNSLDTVKGSATLYLYTHALTELADLAMSSECKSGVDRCLTGVSLSSSQEEWTRTHEAPFDLNTASEEDVKSFSQIFNKYFETFGQPTAIAARGIPEGQDTPLIKTKSSPIFRLFGDIKSLSSKFRF